MQANIGKTPFLGVQCAPFWCPHSRGILLPRATKFCYDKPESHGSPKWRFCDSILHRFNRAAKCDRHTHTETHTQTPRSWL